MSFLFSHWYPVPYLMKFILSYYSNHVGWLPKNGIYGFVPNPPINRETVINKSGSILANLSQVLKIWMPNFLIFSISLDPKCLKVILWCFLFSVATWILRVVAKTYVSKQNLFYFLPASKITCTESSLNFLYYKFTYSKQEPPLSAKVIV